MSVVQRAAGVPPDSRRVRLVAALRPSALSAGPAALLLFIDCALVAGDLLHRNSIIFDNRLLLTTERGYGEIFQYLKFAALAGLLFVTAIRWKSVSSFGWAVLFVVLLLDDAYQIHETVGLMLAHSGSLPTLGKLRASDIGELVFFAVLGTAVLCLALSVWRFGSDRDRTLATVVLAGLLLIAFFGVAMDVVHTLARRTWLQPWAAVVEDGGELLATSIMSAAMIRVLAHLTPSEPTQQRARASYEHGL